jgi:hypothetical protein
MRQLDPASAAVLPMGSHFLWHILGGCAAFCAIQYLFYAEKHSTI